MTGICRDRKVTPMQRFGRTGLTAKRPPSGASIDGYEYVKGEVSPSSPHLKAGVSGE